MTQTATVTGKQLVVETVNTIKGKAKELGIELPTLTYVWHEGIGEGLLACYHPIDQTISIWGGAVARVAKALKVSEEEMFAVVLAHEFGHVLDTQIRDLFVKNEKSVRKLLAAIEREQPFSMFIHLNAIYRRTMKMESASSELGLLFLPTNLLVPYTTLNTKSGEAYQKNFSSAFGDIGALIRKKILFLK